MIVKLLHELTAFAKKAPHTGATHQPLPALPLPRVGLGELAVAVLMVEEVVAMAEGLDLGLGLSICLSRLVLFIFPVMLQTDTLDMGKGDRGERYLAG